jgi:tetratricopeptide (TPR) repeat protein
MSRLAQLQKLAQLAPNDPLTHYGLGLECMNLQDWPAAIAAFAAAIRVDAGYSAAYYHKARAELAAGLAAEARASLEAGLAVAKTKGDWKTQNEMRELLESIP